MKKPTPPSPRIALAMAGDGPVEAIYEAGALCALQESSNGIRINPLQHFAGVSVGGLIAAALVSGITPMRLFAQFLDDRRPRTVQTAELQGQTTW